MWSDTPSMQASRDLSDVPPSKVVSSCWNGHFGLIAVNCAYFGLGWVWVSKREAADVYLQVFASVMFLTAQD